MKNNSKIKPICQIFTNKNINCLIYISSTVIKEFNVSFLKIRWTCFLSRPNFIPAWLKEGNTPKYLNIENC